MGNPLFYLGIEFRDELQGSSPSPVLREEFKKRGCEFGPRVSIQVVGTEYFIIDDEIDNSYVVKEEREKLAAYSAFIRMGTRDDGQNILVEDLYLALRGRFDLIYLENCVIEGGVNISDSGSPKSADGRARIAKEFVCRNCTFTELADFSNTTFEQASNFRGTTFNKGGEFRGTTFQDTSNFDLAAFHEFARFVGANFNQDTHFSGANFSGDALFYRCLFRDSVRFSWAEFQKHADFSEVAFYGGCAFSISTFHAGADFDRAQFVGRIDFKEARTGKPIEFTDIRYWPNSIGQWWRRKLLNQWTRRLMWRNDGQNLQGRWLTRRLLTPRKFPSTPPAEETEFLIESEYISEVSNPLFKRYVADMLLIRAFKMEHPFLAWVWRWSADYGRSLVIWGFWSAVVVLFFSLCYTPANANVPLVGWQMPEGWQQFWLERGPQFQQSVKGFEDRPMTFWSSVYFSVVTFTTLGFGDIATSNGVARIVTTIEVILGYVMLGGLISILSQKLARRS